MQKCFCLKFRDKNAGNEVELFEWLISHTGNVFAVLKFVFSIVLCHVLSYFQISVYGTVYKYYSSMCRRLSDFIMCKDIRPERP